MADFKKAAPPSYARKSTTNTGPFGDFAEHLRSDPDEWYEVPLDERPIRHTAYQINNGLLAAFKPKGAFEAQYNDNATRGDVGVWAKYNTPDPDAPEADDDEPDNSDA